MKTSRITQYDPTLSVEENAANNNVTAAAIRSYIRARGIDRATDRQRYLYNKVKEYAREHQKEKAPQIADALGLTPNTVRRYLKMTEEPQPKEKKTTTINQADKLKFISVSESQTDILKTILSIHLPMRENFQCDLTAWKLGFYKSGLLLKSAYPTETVFPVLHPQCQDSCSIHHKSHYLSDPVDAP